MRPTSPLPKQTAEVDIGGSGLTPEAAATLVGHPNLPRMHVISDVHLERGGYTLPADLEYDILIAAGDIGTAAQAVPWLAAVGKPVIYVLGNHEHYGVEFDEALRTAHHAARGTQVHVLERQSVVVAGVRFLGTTLWTDYGGWHPELVAQALKRLNDYSYISATKWWSAKSNQRLATKMGAKIGYRFTAGKFNPVMGYVEHQRSIAWLQSQL
jgi:hypothetical protein